MKVVANIFRVFVYLLWRLALIAALAAVVLVLGVGILMSIIFSGPSDSARTLLAVNLMEHEATREIPAYFLDQATIDRICSSTDSLPAAISDPSLIAVDPSVQRETVTVTGQTYTAQVSLSPAGNSFVLLSTGNRFAGFNADGVLILAASAAEAEAAGISAPCEHILIMNGQVNESLFAANSAYTARSAIGQRADGTVIHVTMDGGSQDCPGGTVQDLINIMVEYGAVNACSLNGSTVVSED